MNIKEAMCIHVSDPLFNRNLGKYQLPHIWDEVLQDTPPLQLRWLSFTSYSPPHRPPPICILHNIMGSTCNFKLASIIPCGVAFPFPYYPVLTINSLHIPNTQNTPYTPNSHYTPISVVPLLVSTHFDWWSLIFCHRPDEAASVWRLWSLSVINCCIHFVSVYRSY